MMIDTLCMVQRQQTSFINQNNIFKLLMTDSMKSAVGQQPNSQIQLDQDLRDLNAMEDQLQPSDILQKRSPSYTAALEPSQLKKFQQEVTNINGGGGSPEHPIPGFAGAQSTRRAFTVVNRVQGDQESFVYKDDNELQFVHNLNTPSPPKRKKSEKQRKGSVSSKKDAQTPQKNETGLFDRFLRWISCRKNSHREEGAASENGDSHELRNIIVQPHQHPDNLKFVSNSITTTKYTIWSFLPLSIIIQFLRLSNCYFLASGIMTAIPGFSPISPMSTFLPLAFVILMSVLREGYEDFNRRRNDRLTNNMPCLILKNPEKFLDCSVSANAGNSPLGRESFKSRQSHKEDADVLKSNFTKCQWKDVKCGDVIFLHDGEHLPADIVFLMSSEDNGECFVQTSSLDGERALKNKQCLVPLKTAIEKYGLNKFECSVHCEPPTKNLYEFSGYIESEQLPEKGTVSLDGGAKRTITIDNKQLGLRGSNLANTNWVIGVVVYTGKDSKLMLNYGQSRYKQSRIEKVVNIICIYLVILQAVLCLIMSVSSGFYVSQNAELSQDGLRRKAEYIFFTQITTYGRSENGTATDTSSIGYNPTKEAVYTYGQYFVLMNTLIPLSLVVSIEFIKLTQTPFMNNDINMYDETTNKQCEAMNMTLHEEMAQIKYIFADKTGTLTANIMQFKACTIGSVCYDKDYRDEDYDYIMDEQESEEGLNDAKPIDEFPQLSRRSETGAVEALPGQPSKKDRLTIIKEEGIIEEGEIRLTVNEDINDDAAAFQRYKRELSHHFNEQGKESKIQRRRPSITKIVWNFTEAEKIIRNLIQKKRYFLNEETILGRSQQNGPCLVLHKQNEYLHQFWMNCVLCHDVITSLNYQTGLLAYQGTSPDEITLLDAAKEVGYRFLDRNSESMKVEIFGKEKSFKLLQKFEFTSDRKKMSVVIQDEATGLIILYSKGADLAIFDRLSTTLEQHFLEATKEDLIKFSTKGYRTLCFALRVLDETYFKDWVLRYETAKMEVIKLGVNKGKQAGSKFDPSQILIALQNELESELFLLGATALEDKLQDGVPEAIEDFNNAGIKVWMLTGDKLETAENIGFSSKMFNEKMFIFKLQTPDKASTRRRLEQIEQKIIELEKQHAIPVIGTQFVLNPNAATDYEAKNIIRALEEFKHESRNSEYTINDSYIRKPILRRKMRKRLEEIVPDKNAIAERLIRENQVFQRSVQDQLQYIPSSFDLKGNQYIINQTNVYRSANSQRIKNINSSLNIAGVNLGMNNPDGNIVDNEDKYGILVEGHTLAHIIDSKSMTERFLKILGQCQAVVVCRASPSQKAQVVQIIKDKDPEAVTLAIGDGANDVNMIKCAHIGIGIFGKEGYQAAGNSDYAIGQFRYLRRLLFVHGRWSGIRLSTFMLLFFNKNIVYTLPQFWFGWNCGFSGQSYFDEVYMSGFNIFATNFAVCTLAVWDIDINLDDPKKKSIYDLFLPQIYKHSQDNELFTVKKFFAWAAVSILQSLFMYGIPQLTYADYIFPGGKQQDFWAQNVCAYFAIVIQHYISTSFFTKNWTLWLLFWYLMSLALFAPFAIVTYDQLPMGQAIYLRLKEIVFTDWQFWASLVISLGVSLIPFFFYFVANELLFPSIKDLILQEAFDEKAVLNEADPNKAKEAMDIMKMKQQQVLSQWEENYNNFNPPKSPKTNEKQVRTAQVAQTSQNVATRESNINTPNKLLMTTPGKRKNLQTRIQEETKNNEKLPFEVVDDENEEQDFVSPLRNSQSRRKGKLKHSASQILTNEVAGLQLKKIKSHHQDAFQKPISGELDNDEPLRISTKNPFQGRKYTQKNQASARVQAPGENQAVAPYRFSKYRRRHSEGSSLSDPDAYDIEENENNQDDEYNDDKDISNLDAKMQGIHNPTVQKNVFQKEFAQKIRMSLSNEKNRQNK